MSRLLRVPLIAAILFLAPALSANELDTKGADERVVRLIAQLGSSQFDEREAATQQLEALGRVALDPLRRANESEDPEIRRRALKLVRRIEQRVTTSRLLERKPVRLVYQDVPVPLAVSDLARKTGLPVQILGDLTPLAQRRITLDTGATTFWNALAHFCQKAGLVERGLDAGAFQDDRNEYSSGLRKIIALDRTSWGGYSRTSSPLYLTDGKGQELPTCHAGAVRIRALPPATPAVNVTRAEGETLLVLEVLPEPHLLWQNTLAVRVDRAVDDKGRTLRQRTMASGLGETIGTAAEETLLLWDGIGLLSSNPFADARHVPVRFRLADGPSRSLKELSGVIAARMQTRAEPLATVDNLTDATGRAVSCADGSVLKVVEVKQTVEGGYRIRVGLTLPPPDFIHGGIPGRIVLLSRGFWGRGTASISPEEVDFALIDAQGRKFPLVSGEVQGALGKGLHYDFGLHFPPLPNQAAPIRLLYTGRRTWTVEIPFALQNVPLP